MICEGCGRSNDETARYCRYCGRTIHAPVEATIGAGIRNPSPTRFAVGKRPVVALFFALVPGLGQFYNGDFKRGLLVLIGAAVASPLVPFTCTSGFVLLGIWIWGAFNAYSVAAGKTPLW